MAKKAKPDKGAQDASPKKGRTKGPKKGRDPLGALTTLVAVLFSASLVLQKAVGS